LRAPRRLRRLSVALPSSMVSELGHLRQKTEVVGQVARSASIFRVDEVVVYRDEPDESNLIRTLLSYVETPQYLRRYLFGVRPELKYAGVLPPLRTPHHPLGNRVGDLEVGEHREGVVVEEEGGECLVNIGVDTTLRASGRAPSKGSRVTVRITEKSPSLRGVFAKQGEVDQYWGYRIRVAKTGLAGMAGDGGYGLMIATSRTGTPYKDAVEALSKEWFGAESILVAFGSPRRGIDEMLRREVGSVGDVFRFNVNTIPGQGCETVRTEEALQATLAVLNLIE
jgi:predicted SPOUT superfamily RNA methylase MTH1